jgi:hypothetical protein
MSRRTSHGETPCNSSGRCHHDVQTEMAGSTKRMMAYVAQHRLDMHGHPVMVVRGIPKPDCGDARARSDKGLHGGHP